MLQTNLRGEMKVSIKSALSLLDFELISKVSEALHLSSSEELVQLRGALYPSLMCSAAKSGDIDTLEKLRQTVSHNHEQKMAFSLYDYGKSTKMLTLIAYDQRKIIFEKGNYILIIYF